jgi:hypothetical protein
LRRQAAKFDLTRGVGRGDQYPEMPRRNHAQISRERF